MPQPDTVWFTTMLTVSELSKHYGDFVAVDDVSFDGRSGQLKAKDTVELPVAIVHDPATRAVITAERRNFPTGPPRHAGLSPPLHVLHCVYLK